jgi:hypothetical protein
MRDAFVRGVDSRGPVTRLRVRSSLPQVPPSSLTTTGNWSTRMKKTLTRYDAKPPNQRDEPANNV